MFAKYKKGEITTQQIVLIIILVASFAVILFFIIRLNFGGQTAQDICHNSVVTRGSAIVPDSQFPLKCQRQYVCLSASGSCNKMTNPTIIKVKTKNDVYKALADQMATCWWEFGEGKIDYAPSTSSPQNYCSICSQIAFDSSVNKIFGGTNFNKKDFYTYLAHTKMSSGQTYQDYFLLNGILNYQGNFGTVNMTKEYYSLMGITTKVSTLGWIAKGAVAIGGAAAIVTTIVLSGGTATPLLAIIGTTAAGTVVGGAAGYARSMMFIAPTVKGPSGNGYIPPSLIQVNSPEFHALNCSLITTSS